jgi:hypothetical protein
MRAATGGQPDGGRAEVGRQQWHDAAGELAGDSSAAGSGARWRTRVGRSLSGGFWLSPDPPAALANNLDTPLPCFASVAHGKVFVVCKHTVKPLPCANTQ